MKIYHGDFQELADVISEFKLSETDLERVEIIYAIYDCPPYEGYAFVVYKKDGKLYEVNGSHCSCYGLGGQWEPEETFKEALLKYSESYPKVTEEFFVIVNSLPEAL